MPLIKNAIATYYVLVKSEASSNLSRYDGIHYGFSALKSKYQISNINSLLDVYLKSREAGFGPEPKRSIMMGAYTLSAGYYDAYYKKAAKVRTLIKQEFEQALTECDVLLTPVSPFPAFKKGEKLNDPLQMYLADVNTVPINVAGVPAISIPAGFAKDGLPIGLQLIGPAYGEDKILNFAHQFQQATEWHKTKPRLL
jgi:aspartyl-tRNA(Asn)/glutamyl-tRNA(Gln) amidotransferase subunit A